MLSHKSRIFFITLLILIVIFTGYLFLKYRDSNQLHAGDGSANLSNIPALSGWQMSRIGTDRITFARDGGGPFLDRIEVSASKIHDSLSSEIARNYNHIPVSSSSNLYIGWNDIPMKYGVQSSVPIGWATINGNLVLVTNNRETDTGTVINYSIFNNDAVYMFSTPYQFYEPASKIFVTKYPETVKTLQKMVQDFALSLPSGISE